jgi:hypothetical protein
MLQNKLVNYTTPQTIPTNKYAFKGNWQVEGEYALSKAGSELILNFEASKVFLVMKPHQEGASYKVKIFVDEQQLFFGEHNDQGTVTVDSAKLYELVKFNQKERHILRLHFVEGNIEVFAFTFG